MNANIVNHRLPGEGALEYRSRRRFVARLLKRHAAGRPAEGYVPGPHRSHKPHEVKASIDVPWVDAYGVRHDSRELKVTHPGTLVRKVAK